MEGGGLLELELGGFELGLFGFQGEALFGGDGGFDVGERLEGLDGRDVRIARGVDEGKDGAVEGGVAVGGEFAAHLVGAGALFFQTLLLLQPGLVMQAGLLELGEGGGPEGAIAEGGEPGVDLVGGLGVVEALADFLAHLEGEAREGGARAVGRGGGGAFRHSWPRRIGRLRR